MDSFLLQEIQKGKKLRSTKTVDKSGPYIPKNEFNSNETITDIQSIGENNSSFNGENKVKAFLTIDLSVSTKSNKQNAVENKIDSAKKNPTEYFQAPGLQQQVAQNSNVLERDDGARSLPLPPPPPPAPQQVPPRSPPSSDSQTFHPAAKTLSAAEGTVTLPQLQQPANTPPVQHPTKDTCKIESATSVVINAQPTSTNSQQQQGTAKLNFITNKNINQTDEKMVSNSTKTSPNISKMNQTTVPIIPSPPEFASMKIANNPANLSNSLPVLKPMTKVPLNLKKEKFALTTPPAQIKEIKKDSIISKNDSENISASTLNSTSSQFGTGTLTKQIQQSEMVKNSTAKSESMNIDLNNLVNAPLDDLKGFQFNIDLTASGNDILQLQKRPGQ